MVFGAERLAEERILNQDAAQDAALARNITDCSWRMIFGP